MNLRVYQYSFPMTDINSIVTELDKDVSRSGTRYGKAPFTWVTDEVTIDGESLTIAFPQEEKSKS